MKKVLSSSAVLLVLLFAAVAAAPPAGAQPCFTCPSWFAWSNAEWGMGATCEDAERNAILNAYYWTYSACGFHSPCNWGAEQIVTECMWDGTQWKADGRVQFTCPMDLCY
jgi:hypothetical protein